ncbi:(2Fe-2S) ferredoxin domain-containing protein [Stigmatella sp. ncwal1]|uniref:(2Fe-2S) ferredoxin domain-containing protein n=1 Tax=Stigmatella ashevillensis TaxID=2995309 RepID=A0ABT5DE56_9BACT|nr:(2Fe-2S) ferredoxin domain-containing protein [Stigmatella ashevillena]MDC0711937.1 (2Fe-2S) ferredoxin domain-containing protein [Stigmatella ashevillena]
MSPARPIRPLWKSGAVLVCRKCSGNKALDLRRWLKRRLKEDGHEDHIRVLRVGCLDVCPKRRVTTVVQPLPGHAGGGCFVVDPEEEGDDFYLQVLKLLGPSGPSR